jgi:hypothetical protein
MDDGVVVAGQIAGSPSGLAQAMSQQLQQSGFTAALPGCWKQQRQPSQTLSKSQP